VRFINEYGLPEAGIDQNGVFKEFLEVFCVSFSFRLFLILIFVKTNRISVKEPSRPTFRSFEQPPTATVFPLLHLSSMKSIFNYLNSLGGCLGRLYMRGL
jgi:hypothetical protein